MVTVYVTYQDDSDVEMEKVCLATYPRVGEKIGVRPMRDGDNEVVVKHYYLDTVVDVRQYVGRLGDPPDVRAEAVAPEYHVLTSSRP